MVNSENNQSLPPIATEGKRRGTSGQRTDTRLAKKTDSPKQSDKPTRWVQIRLIPIWLRVVIVLILLFIAVIAGLNIGYSVIGGGEDSGIFKWSTWQHVLDIINGVE